MTAFSLPHLLPGGPQRRSAATGRGPRPTRTRSAPSPSLVASPGPGLPAAAEQLSLSSERRELLCSVIGLTVKLGLVAVAGVSLVRLAGVYQQRMDHQGEMAAVLELQTARLVRARERFDQLFMVQGEQRLIREQSQWIAPNRMRIIWQNADAPSRVETASLPRQPLRPAAQGVQR